MSKNISFKILFVAILTLAKLTAFAAGMTSEQIENDYNKLTSERAALDQKLQMLYADAQDLLATNNADQSMDDNLGAPTRVNDAILKNYEQQRKVEARIFAEITEQQKSIAKIDKELEAKGAKINNAQATELQEQLRKELQIIDLKTDFSSLFAKHGQVDDVLDAVEQNLDQALLGAYVQDKMGQLVNSITMCKAMRRCEVPGEKAIPAEDIRKELFPSSDMKSIRKDYYNKVKGRRTTTTK